MTFWIRLDWQNRQEINTRIHMWLILLVSMINKNTENSEVLMFYALSVLPKVEICKQSSAGTGTQDPGETGGNREGNFQIWPGTPGSGGNREVLPAELCLQVTYKSMATSYLINLRPTSDPLPVHFRPKPYKLKASSCLLLSTLSISCLCHRIEST